MRVALVQPEQRAGDRAGNVDRAVEGIDQAAADGTDLVALPALFNVGFHAYDSYAREAEPLDGPTLSRLSAVAAGNDIGLVAGTVVEDLEASAAAGLPVPEPEGYASTAVVFDRDGTRQAVYRTRQLAGYSTMSGPAEATGTPSAAATVGVASSAPTVSFDAFTVGVVGASDLFDPDPVAGLVAAGATLVIVVSGWSYPRVEQWDVLTRARALENACFLGAVNGVGTFDDETLLGRSRLVDPDGVRIAGSGEQPTVVSARLDPRRVEEVRATNPP